MNESTFNPISIYALPVEEQDLALFDTANDLLMEPLAMAYDDQRIDAAIEQKARQAQLRNDAEGALVLAGLFKDDEHRRVQQLELAEAAAFALGQHSFQRGHTCTNPFSEPALVTAWNNGYVTRAHLEVVAVPENSLEAKLWNLGVDVDGADSRFELAAVACLRLADCSGQARVKVRAQRLAREMMCYHQRSQVPSQQRQLEIDRFLQVQTRRLAAAIDFIRL